MLASVFEKILRRFGLSRFLVSFFSGIVFSLIAVYFSLLTGFGFVALFVISVAVLPVITRAISLSELISGRVSVAKHQGVLFEDFQFHGKRWSLKEFFLDFLPLFKIYLVYFLTVFAVFVQVGAFLDFEVVSRVFSGQFGFFDLGKTVDFSGLVLNNFGVLFLGFLFSFLFEFGATFVVMRNAIFWGLTLGLFLSSFSASPFALLLIFPHLVLEASAYFISSIGGSVLSRAVIEEKIHSERFFSLLTQVVALLVVSFFLVLFGAAVETIVFNSFFKNFYS